MRIRCGGLVRDEHAEARQRHHAEVPLEDVVVLVPILEEIAVRHVIVQHVVLDGRLVHPVDGHAALEGHVDGISDQLRIRRCAIKMEMPTLLYIFFIT